MTWWDRLKHALWQTHLEATGTSALPATPAAQHYQETEEDAFRRAHGYSKATTPAPWSADISKHNVEVEAEYVAEIESRKLAYMAGTYKPRFVTKAGMDLWMNGQREALTVDHIDWDLELSADPGRRKDVTHEEPALPMLSDLEHATARMAGALGREVTGLERGNEGGEKSVRDMIGSRASILLQCGGNEATADQVEQKARVMFGVDDLEAPYTGPTEKYLHAGT